MMLAIRSRYEALIGEFDSAAAKSGTPRSDHYRGSRPSRTRGNVSGARNSYLRDILYGVDLGAELVNFLVGWASQPTHNGSDSRFRLSAARALALHGDADRALALLLDASIPSIERAARWWLATGAPRLHLCHRDRLDARTQRTPQHARTQRTTEVARPRPPAIRAPTLAGTSPCSPCACSTVESTKHATGSPSPAAPSSNKNPSAGYRCRLDDDAASMELRLGAGGDADPVRGMHRRGPSPLHPHRNGRMATTTRRP